MDIIDENALDPDFGERFERGRRPDCQLYLISPPELDMNFPERLARALDGGAVAAFQLRLKGMDEHAIAKLAEPLQTLCGDHDVAFIINDSIGLAKRLGADGVHLGQNDGDPRDAREILGRDAQIGVTCHNSRHLAMEAGEAGADYIAFGAFYQSGTKIVEYIADTTLLEWWTTISGVPCVAIGGITTANAAPIIDAGADFIAVSGAVWGEVGHEDVVVAQFAALMA
jgi:thiamine-phosphate pyrophosphorylase